MAMNNVPVTGNGTAGVVYGIGPYGTAAGFGVDAAGNPSIIGTDGTVIQTFMTTGTQSRTTRTTITQSTGSGIKASVQNPFNAPAVVERVIIDYTTASGNTNVATVGTSTVATTVPVANLIDTQSLNAAAPQAYDNISFAGTNGKSIQHVGATDYVNLNASAATTALVGVLIVQWRKV